MKRFFKNIFIKIGHAFYYALLILFNLPTHQWEKKYVKGLYARGIDKGLWKNHKKQLKECFLQRPFLQKTKVSFYRYLLDFRLCSLFLGTECGNYFGCQLYKHGWRYRNACVSWFRVLTVSKIVNKNEQRHYIDNKSETAELYQNLFGRKCLRFPGCTMEAFHNTFSQCKRIIVKPESSTGGAGIKVFTINNNLDELYQEILEYGSAIVEEYYEQKGFLHDINPSSLNTLRVITFRVSDEKVYILNAFLRAGGKDAVVDNYHSGGYCYGIDIETGMLLCGNRSDFERNVKYHPSTMVRVEGNPVPRWNEVVDFCKNAHFMTPKGLDILGWDICVSDNEIVIIEANVQPGSHHQKGDHGSVWKRMKKSMNEWEAANKQ